MNCGILFMFMTVAFSLSSGQNMNKAAQLTAKTRRLPDLKTCGSSLRSFGTRIIKGRPAKLGEFPWMANLGYRLSSLPTKYWQCAGSLITEQYVITAAHCVIPAMIRPFTLKWVRLGDLDLNETATDGASPVDFEVEKFTAHPEYSSLTRVNDIAIIKIKGKVTFSDFIKPICLPPPGFSINMFVGYDPKIAGWGRNSTNKTDPKNTQLLEAQVTIKETEECRANVTQQLKSVIIDERVICAASDINDSCQGDSGAPLMFFDKLLNSTGNVYLMGIVSYGYRCAEPGYPGVYTRVANHMAWIIDNLDI